MLINVAETVVTDALKGMASAHPELNVDVENRVIVRRDAPVAGKVALVSGGGSGHEPLHGGFVGPGMLAAACPGEVFTSPVPDQMVRAAAAVDSGAGVLFIVKNYTGDVLNFDMAAELAEDEGVQVAKVLVNDDVAVTDSLYTAGRRGTGATLFVEKIAGAAAEEGQPLERVEAIARQVNENARSFGVALSACSTPSKGAPTFDLPSGELELGIGIHGEPGRERRSMMTSGEIADYSVNVVLEDLNPSSPVLVLVNGMGATPCSSSTGSTPKCSGCWRSAACPSPARSSGTTSPRSTWPAPPSRSARPTRSCCACGTRRSARPGSAGACRQGCAAGACARHALVPRHIPHQRI